MNAEKKHEYLEFWRGEYVGSSKAHKGRILDEVSATFSWERKHTIKALSGKVSLGKFAGKRGRKAIYGDQEKAVIVDLWRCTGQPGGKRFQKIIPLWLESYELRYGELKQETRQKVLTCSPRQLDRITEHHKESGKGAQVRQSGSVGQSLRSSLSFGCHLKEGGEPGWFTVSSILRDQSCGSSGPATWSLAFTDVFSGWMTIAKVSGNTPQTICSELQEIGRQWPLPVLGYEAAKGGESIRRLLKNSWHDERVVSKAGALTNYGESGDVRGASEIVAEDWRLLVDECLHNRRLLELVNELYEAWLPLWNFFTPAAKLVEKTKVDGKFSKKYDEPKTPFERLLECSSLPTKIKEMLGSEMAGLDPIELSESLEEKFTVISEMVVWAEKQRRSKPTTQGEDEWSEAVAG